ncbi:hypothetical protein CK501_06545 [Halovibrio salipaludis]|uniref:NodB homology domain-containing protein n=1 Tax=Halovibrio salipaludis TaxID=2032626 RepID=A0A2A2F915_9GAMM|nr:polysaccharide deacetylase family protein [Halovibrio salipaludis]PAU81214.1 hypothetical protein CK501_06545 [Halovibrio salipaludis]
MLNLSGLIKKIGPLFGYRVAHSLTRPYPRILMYHRFSEDKKEGYICKKTLSTQLDLLMRETEIVSLGELILNYKNPNFLKNRKKPVSVITIDDGYRDFYNIFYPLLKERDIPATFFVATAFVDGERWLWHDRLRWCIENKPSGITYFKCGELFIDANKTPKPDDIWKKLVSRLLEQNGKSIENEINKLAKQFGVSIPSSPPEEYAPVTWNEIRDMARNKIEIGGHTVNHYSLGQLTDSEIHTELNECSKRIDQETGKKPISFCFPNGQPQDVPENLNDHFQKTDFKAATVAFYDSLGISDDYQLRRHGVGEDFFAFKKTVYGIDWLGARLLNRNSKFDWGC